MSGAPGPTGGAALRDLTLSYKNVIISVLGDLLEVVVESPTGTKGTQISLADGSVVGGQHTPKEE